MVFGEKVKAVRRKLLLSQAEFAQEIGVSYPTVNRWENGKFEPSYKAQRAFYDYCRKHNIETELDEWN